MSDATADFTDDELYASYEAYKTLLDAGLTKEQALDRTGITPQIVKDFEDEEQEDEFKDEFKEEWDEEDLKEGFDEDGDFANDDMDDDFEEEESGYDETFD